MTQQGTKHRVGTRKAATVSASSAASGHHAPPKAQTRAGLGGMSLRARVSFLVMAAVGITVMVAAIVSYMTIRTAITNRLDMSLSQKVNLLLKDPTFSDPAELTDPRNSGITGTLYLAGLQESIVSSAGTVYSSLPEPNAYGGSATIMYAAAPVGGPELAVASGQLAMSVRTVSTNTGTYRVMAVPDNGVPDSGYAMVVATSMATTDDTLHVLRIVSVLVGLIGIAIAGIAGFWIGRTALRPVEKLTVATEYIARTGDLRQIEVTGNDELARLTASFNTMLLALARSREYQKRLVADAGHELRTPLTSIRTNLDLLAQATAEPDNPRLSAQDRAELMTDVRAQMEELSILIADLVELSRDERPAHAVELIDFADVVDRAVQRVQRRNPSLAYDIELESWYLDGEPAALERMVTNLLDNAAKWSPPGGTVTVRLREGALRVADQGPGIAEHDLKHVFERFFRSPEARTMPGSGLGLAIVRQVAENHGGRVAAARAQGGGALLGVWLPGNPGPLAGEVEPMGALEPAPASGQLGSGQLGDSRLSPMETLGTAAAAEPTLPLPGPMSAAPPDHAAPAPYEFDLSADPPLPPAPPFEEPPAGGSPPPGGEPSGATRTAPGSAGP